MKNQKIRIEKELASNSSTIIWNLIGTPEGLSRWIADDVKLNENILSFTWGEAWRHQEVKTARIVEIVKKKYIRFHWDSWDKDGREGNEDLFTEIKMEYNDLTNDYILVITDYAEDNDVESLKGLWEDDFERLHRSSGI